MTEQTQTTEPAEGGNTASQENGANTTTQTQTTQPDAKKSLFDGFSAEDLSYLEKKGWNEENFATQALKSYQNMEKLMGGSKNLIELPKDGDAEGYKSALRKLGLPETKEGYSFETDGDAQKEAMIGHLRDVAIKSNMTKGQFNDFVSAFMEKDKEIGEINKNSFLNKKKNELNEYAQEQGKEFANVKDKTDRAMRMYGISEEERAGLENSIGIKRFYDLFGTIGKNLVEGNLVTKANDNVTSTRETYQMELDKLFTDREFMVKYMSGDLSAIGKVNELNSKISGAR